MKSLLKRKFFRSVSVRLVGTVIVAFAGIINSILTARLLGPDGKGVYFLIYSTLNMVIAIGAIKLAYSQVFYRKEMSFGELTGITITLSVITGLLACGAGFVALYILRDSIYSEVPWELLLIALALVPVLLLGFNLRSALDSDYQTGPATIVMASRSVLFTITFSLFALLGWQSIGAAFTSMCISVCGMVLIGIMYVFRIDGISFHGAGVNYLCKMVRYGFRSHFGMIFRFMQDRFDIFVVAYFMTSTDVGLYSVALAIAEITAKLSKVTSTVLLGRIAKTRDERKSIEMTMRLNRIVFFISMILVVGVGLLAGIIVNLAFGEMFTSAIEASRLLLPGVMGLVVYTVLTTNLISSGRPGTFSIVTLIGVIVMLVGDFLLIPQYGINGAAIASSIAYVVSGVLTSVLVVTSNHYPLKEYFNAGPEIKAALSMIKGQ